jgi:hypothetical protein
MNDANERGDETMNADQLNALPHATKDDLDAIPSITLIATSGPKWMIGSKTRVFAATETVDGWEGSVRLPVTGDFAPRQLYSRDNYKSA